MVFTACTTSEDEDPSDSDSPCSDPTEESEILSSSSSFPS